MTLIILLKMLHRQLVFVVATTLIGLSAGAVYAITQAPRYQASTDVMLYVQVDDEATSSDRNTAANYIGQVAASYRQLITTPLVLDPVIDNLGLNTTPGSLASNIQVSASTRGSVFTITAISPNPAHAARLANAVADSFALTVTDNLERRNGDAGFTVRIVPLDQADVPIVPSSPNMRLSLAIGTALGIGIGIGIALLRATLDTRIRTIDELNDAVDAPLLGIIKHDPNADHHPLVVVTDPRNPRSEAFRVLRTNTRFLFPDDSCPRFVITSSGPGEGKTTTAANLALTFAEAGYRTVLIDADMRLPRLATTFGIEGGIGLAEALIGRVGLEDVLQRWGRGTLFLLPAGSIPPNPAELLGSSAMDDLLDDLSQAFEIIIIDSPPLPIVTDAAVLSQKATGTILIAAAGISTRPRLSDAVASIENADGRVIGTVMTRLPARKSDNTPYGNVTHTATSASPSV